MIRVQCPNCGSQFNTVDANAGKATRCPNCSSALTIPSPPAGGGAPQPLAPAAPVPQQAGTTIYVQAPGMAAPAMAPRPVAGTHGGMAVAGMVLGIVGVALAFTICLWWLGLICGIVGVILSIIALATAGKTGRKKGMAVAGLICSGLAIIWGPLWVYVFVSALFAGASHSLFGL